jgi:hypothetical protein
MRKLLLSLLVVVLLVVPSLAGGAEVKEENISDEKAPITEAGKAVADAAFAGQLAELGRAQKSPLILASAAQILGSAGEFVESPDKPTEDPSVPAREASATAKAGKGADDTVESLYAEAIAMAKESGDADLAGVLEKQSRVGAGRGRRSGATQVTGRVRGAVYYEWRFNAGRTAEVMVVGDGDDIDLYVYDENGNLVARDADSSTVCYASWCPAWTGVFRVEVRNASGSSYIDYVVRTN